MRKIYLALALWLAAIVSSFAQAPGETGFRLTPGAGICVAGNIVSQCLPFKDQSAANYTFVGADQGSQLLLGAFTYTLPQAGTAGFPAGWRMWVLNYSTLTNAVINTTTSIFRAGGETTTLLLPPMGFGVIESDGVNYKFIGVRAGAIIADPSTNRTLGEFECNNMVFFTSTGTTPISVSLSASAHVGCSVDVTSETGAPQITFAPAGSGTLKSFDSFTHTAGPYAGVTLRVMSNATGSNAEWFLFGRGS